MVSKGGKRDTFSLFFSLSPLPSLVVIEHDEKVEHKGSLVVFLVSCFLTTLSAARTSGKLLCGSLAFSSRPIEFPPLH